MAHNNPESSPLFIVLTLLVLAHHGFGSKVPSNPEAKLHRLLYKDKDTTDMFYCHLCTQNDYSREETNSEPCFLSNRDVVYNVNGVNYRPWCRAGVGILPTCPEPRQPEGGRVNCRKYGTRVYEVCNVTCPAFHQPLSPNITCQEENLQWSAEPSCVVSECPPLNAVENVAIKCETEGPIKVGASCNASCPPGFRPDREVVECQKDGTWTRTPRCEPDKLPNSGDDTAGLSGGANVLLAVLVVVLGVAVALVVTFCFVRRQKMQRGIYMVSRRENSSDSGMDLPVVTTMRSSRVSAWNSISSLLRSFFRQGSLTRREGRQRSSDAESASNDSDPDAGGEEIEMLPLDGGPHSDEEEGEGEDAADSVPGASSTPAQEGSPPSQEASPLLSAGGGSADQESTNGMEMSPQPADDKPAAAGNGWRGEAGGKEGLSSSEVEAEVHSLSVPDLEMEDDSPEEPKGFPDHIPNPLIRRRSRSSDPSDGSEPTYKYNLQEPIGFKVTYNIGGSKASSSIIERDTEIRVTKGLVIQISAKCQDHDDEVENFSVRLLDEASGRGNVIKEATGNSFRFCACLISPREVYILSAQTSRTRRKNIVRYTVYTLGWQVHNDDPDETKVKELYQSPPPCFLPSRYTQLPWLPAPTSTVSNSDNQRTTKESHKRPPFGNSRELPGPPGPSTLPSCIDSFAAESGWSSVGTLPDMGSLEAGAPVDAGECRQFLSELLESSSLPWITQLLHKLEPIRGRKEAMSIRGLYLHYQPEEKERVDYICWAKQTDLHCSPARVLLERLSQEGMKTGHLVSYFAQPDHRSLDLLRMLGQAHPFQSCPPCHQVVSRIT